MRLSQDVLMEPAMLPAKRRIHHTNARNLPDAHPEHSLQCVRSLQNPPCACEAVQLLLEFHGSFH
jgi:hypothetical protein